MAGEAETAAAIKKVKGERVTPRHPMGFDATPVRRKAVEVSSDAQKHLEDLVAKYQRETQRAVERVVGSLTDAVKGAGSGAGSRWLHHHAGDTDDLRKDAELTAQGWRPAEIAADRANRERAARREGAELGRRVGDVLVKGAELAKARLAAG